MSKAHIRMQNTLNKMNNCEQRKILMNDLISNSYEFRANHLISNTPVCLPISFDTFK